LLVALTSLAAGCLSRPALVRQNFAFQTPPAEPVATNVTGVLAIRSFEVSPVFDSRALIYRSGAESYEVDPFAALMVPPRAALEVPVRAWLRNTGSFREVTEPGSLVPPDHLLEVQVSELYGDLRDRAHPFAVLTMRFTFFRTGNGSPPAAYLRKDYSRRMAVAENSAASVVAGWNQGLAGIMMEVKADLAAAGGL